MTRSIYDIKLGDLCDELGCSSITISRFKDFRADTTTVVAGITGTKHPFNRGSFTVHIDSHPKQWSCYVDPAEGLRQLKEKIRIFKERECL